MKDLVFPAISVEMLVVVNTIPLHGTREEEENVEFKDRSERERKVCPVIMLRF